MNNVKIQQEVINLKARKFEYNDIFYKDGDPTDKLYFLKYGEVELVKKNHPGQIIDTGRYFGDEEVGQLLPKRQSTARCISEVAVLFEMHLETLFPLLPLGSPLQLKVSNFYQQ